MNLKIDENIIYAFSKPPLFNPFSNNILDKKKMHKSSLKKR